MTVDSAKRLLGFKQDSELADFFKVRPQAIHGWRKSLGQLIPAKRELEVQKALRRRA